MPLPVVAAVAGGKLAAKGISKLRGAKAKAKAMRPRRRRRRTLTNGEKNDISFLRSTLGPTHGHAAVTAYLTSRR